MALFGSRRRRGKQLSLIALALAVMVDRRLRRKGMRLTRGKQPLWQRLARDMVLKRIGYFSPPWIAFRLARRITRRYVHLW